MSVGSEGLKVSVSLGLKVSKSEVFKVCIQIQIHQCHKASRCEGLKVLRSKGLRISKSDVVCVCLTLCINTIKTISKF